jgi:hypothetical protein
MRASLALLVLLAACTGPDDKPGDTAGDSDTDGDTDLPTDDTGTADPHAPSKPEIVIAPAAPPAGVGFSVVLVTPSVDPDGDVVGYRYAWSENGTLRADLASEAVAGTETADGETWAVTVTPTDGTLDGTPATATVTIGGNSAPSAFGVTFSPALPLDGEDFSIVLDPAPVDPDGDPLTVSVTWWEDESLNTVHTDKLTIEGRYVSGGEQYRAIVSVTDGYHEPVVAEGTVTVANNPPEIDSVRVEPTNPADAQDLVVTARASDPDGSDVTFSYAWYRDGVEATDVGDTDTVPAAATQVDETWYVVVTASDGGDEVSATSDSVTVIPFDGMIYAQSFTARIAPGGETGTGTFAYEMLTHGERVGDNECALQWEAALTEDARVCPGCEYSFDVAFTYDASASTPGSGRDCESLADDADGIMTYTSRRTYFTMNLYSTDYYGSAYMSVSGTGSYTYDGTYSYEYSNYGFTEETDTAGYTTLTAFETIRRFYYR